MVRSVNAVSHQCVGDFLVDFEGLKKKIMEKVIYEENVHVNFLIR